MTPLRVKVFVCAMAAIAIAGCLLWATVDSSNADVDAVRATDLAGTAHTAHRLQQLRPPQVKGNSDVVKRGDAATAALDAARRPQARCIRVLVEKPVFWESDLIFRLLLKEYANMTTQPWSHTAIRLPQDAEAMEANPCDKVVILHYKTGEHCPATREFFRRMQPTVVFLLSDEFGLDECNNNISAATADLVLRQYSVRKYGWTEHPNVLHMVSGTQGFDGLAALEATLKLPRARRYVWSFSGSKKHDRGLMAKVMGKHLRPNRLQFFGMPPAEMAKVYMESMFVPVGRGDISLDCFRMYEACRAGAIPIVVGPPDEIAKTFSTFLGYEERLPPCVFADTWPHAVDAVKLLLANATALEERQQQALRFWWHSIALARAAVQRVLGQPAESRVST